MSLQTPDRLRAGATIRIDYASNEAQILKANGLRNLIQVPNNPEIFHLSFVQQVRFDRAQASMNAASPDLEGVGAVINPQAVPFGDPDLDALPNGVVLPLADLGYEYTVSVSVFELEPTIGAIVPVTAP